METIFEDEETMAAEQSSSGISDGCEFFFSTFE